MSRFSLTILLIAAIAAVLAVFLSRMDTSVPETRIEKSVGADATNR